MTDKNETIKFKDLDLKIHKVFNKCDLTVLDALKCFTCSQRILMRYIQHSFEKYIIEEEAKRFVDSLSDIDKEIIINCQILSIKFFEEFYENKTL